MMSVDLPSVSKHKPISIMRICLQHRCIYVCINYLCFSRVVICVSFV